jgi:hypothetical protein
MNISICNAQIRHIRQELWAADAPTPVTGRPALSSGARRTSWYVRKPASGTFPKGIGTIPKGIGTIPKGIGTFPKGIGTFPKGIGTIPKVIGTFPKGIGTIPKGIGTFPKGIGTFQKVVCAPKTSFYTPEKVFLSVNRPTVLRWRIFSPPYHYFLINNLNA